MALFKVSRGSSTRLPTTKKDGWVYFLTDTGDCYMDVLNTSTNVVERKKLSADFADRLRYKNNGSTIVIEPSQIALKSMVSTANVLATATIV